MNNIYEDLSTDDLQTRLAEAETILKQVSESYIPNGREASGRISEAILTSIVSYRRKHRV
jgi:hypothetical protein